MGHWLLKATGFSSVDVGNTESWKHCLFSAEKDRGWGEWGWADDKSGGLLWSVWKCRVCSLTLADSRRRREGVYDHTNPPSPTPHPASSHNLHTHSCILLRVVTLISASDTRCWMLLFSAISLLLISLCLHV